MKNLALFLSLILAIPIFATDGTWALSTTHVPSPNFNAIRLTYSPFKKVNGMTGEILVSSSGTHFILNLHWCPLDTDKREKEVLVTTKENVTKHYTPYCCLGGQKLFFSEEDSNELISHLVKGESLSFAIGMYSTLIGADGFSPHWGRAQYLLNRGLIHFSDILPNRI